MKNTIINLYKKYREIIWYLFFGVCTTAVNTICYSVLYDILFVNNIVSTIIAWFVAVIFAFVTNKIWVFKSRSKVMSEQMRELISFFGCRALTGVLDVAIMAIAVDCMGWNGILWKLISNVIVIVLNYIASKFWIFEKKV